MEGRNPIDRLSWSDVRRDGKTDLSRNRCLAQATDCFVSEPVVDPNADQLEDIRLEDRYGRPSGSSWDERIKDDAFYLFPTCSCVLFY